MRTGVAFLLALAAVAQASDGKPGPNWSYGFEDASRAAGRKNRLILLRQVHCDCDGPACAALDLARRPPWIDQVSTKDFVESSFVLAVAHAPKEGDAAGLVHPRFIPADFRRELNRVRTLIVTPTGHVIHRLDLCPHSGEIDAELAFARQIRRDCFTSTWAPVPGWEERLRALHAEHAFHPTSWHKTPAATADPGSSPWTGYAKLDLAWQPDLDAAKDWASKTDRLVFFFQVVGDLDKEGC
jgi:hypothetical protein